MFEQFILPQMSAAPHVDWDSESDNEEGTVDSLEVCRAKCEAKTDCKQFAMHDDGLCKTRVDPRLGKATTGVRSGWLRDRMLQFDRDMAPCGDEGWMM